MKPIVPVRVGRRFRHTLSRLYQPKELIPVEKLGSAKKIDEITSKSSRLLIEHGIIKSTAAGYFSILPLGTRSLNKLVKIIDTELENLNCQRITLPHVTPAHLWKQTDRLTGMGPELVRFKDRHNKEMVLSPTHEEAITKLVSLYGLSLHDLPLRLYQIGAKFRAEMKPRFGLLRANEFLMKDLYTFDRNTEQATATYDQIAEGYDRIFARIGVPFIRVEGDTGAIGGSLSHEYHIPAGIGQDELLWCTTCKTGRNLELSPEEGERPICKACDDKGYEVTKGIEVAHTFLLGQKYSKVFKATYTGEGGGNRPLEMGCYGIGVSRLLAASVEVLSTNTDLRWPSLIAPFSLIILTPRAGSKEEGGTALLDPLHESLDKILPNDIIIDDRLKFTLGKKLYDAKRTGYPLILVIGKKSVRQEPVLELHIPAQDRIVEGSPSEIMEYVNSIKANYVV